VAYENVRQIDKKLSCHTSTLALATGTTLCPRKTSPQFGLVIHRLSLNISVKNGLVVRN